MVIPEQFSESVTARADVAWIEAAKSLYQTCKCVWLG